MKKKNLRVVVVLLLFAMIFAPVYKMETHASTKNAQKAATVKKPGQVKGLKKVKVNTKWDGHRNVSSIKIKYNKVKGATGYQILIYRVIPAKTIKDYGIPLETPLVYVKTTKKTTYTIKNLVPGIKYRIKVRAYKRGKNGKMIYGKATFIKITTPGNLKGSYYTCNTCLAVMPQNGLRVAEHGESTRKVHGEIHAGGTLFWR